VNLEWVAVNVGIEWNSKAIKFHVMAPKKSQQRYRHQWCIFLLSFDMCFVILSPKIAFIFDTNWQVWSCVYNMSWSCWISMTWFKVKKGWKVFVDLHGHHDLGLFKTHWSFNPLSLRWVVSKPKENIMGHKKEKAYL
jgi:hypothetical protein